MSAIVSGPTVALALAAATLLGAASPASAQGAGGLDRVESTQGSHISTRYRGRVGGYRAGPRFYGGHRHYGGGGYIAGGIAAGIAGALIYNGYNGYYGPGYYYRSAPYLSCGELEYRCDRGEGWACRRLDVSPRC